MWSHTLQGKWFVVKDLTSWPRISEQTRMHRTRIKHLLEIKHWVSHLSHSGDICQALASAMRRPLTSSTQELPCQSWPDLVCSIRWVWIRTPKGLSPCGISIKKNRCFFCHWCYLLKHHWRRTDSCAKCNDKRTDAYV